MFGSRIVKRVMYEVLSGEPAITAVVGSRITYGLNHPQGTSYPALIYYQEQNDYGQGAINTDSVDDLNEQNLRFAVRIDDANTTDARIAPVADAQIEALHGTSVDTTDKGRHVTVTFHAIGELPLSPYDDPPGDRNQVLGTVYSVKITRGGNV